MWKGGQGKGGHGVRYPLIPPHGRDGTDPYGKGYKEPQPHHGDKALSIRMSTDIPPAWGPEMSHYPLSVFKSDLHMWQLTCTISEERQGPLLICQLQGVARAQLDNWLTNNDGVDIKSLKLKQRRNLRIVEGNVRHRNEKAHKSFLKEWKKDYSRRISNGKGQRPGFRRFDTAEEGRDQRPHHLPREREVDQEEQDEEHAGTGFTAPAAEPFGGGNAGAKAKAKAGTRTAQRRADRAQRNILYTEDSASENSLEAEARQEALHQPPNDLSFLNEDPDSDE